MALETANPAYTRPKVNCSTQPTIRKPYRAKCQTEPPILGAYFAFKFKSLGASMSCKPQKARRNCRD